MVASSSQKQYLTTFRGIIKKARSSDINTILKFIKDSTDVKNTTKLSYLNSIIGLKKIDDTIIEDDIKAVIEYRDELNTGVEKAREKNNLNETQEKALNEVSMSDLTKFADKLEQNKKKSKKALENYILVKLMTSFPIRNDLMEIYLTNHKKDLKKDMNMLYIPLAKNKEALLKLKEYKTSKTYGDIDINIPVELTNDIKKLIKKDGRKFLFVNQKGESLSSSSFSHKLERLFKNEFNHPIGSTIIRKIYLTSKYGDTLKDMKADSKLFGHDLTTQQKVYIRNRSLD
jgi:hypothetical protein